MTSPPSGRIRNSTSSTPLSPKQGEWNYMRNSSPKRYVNSSNNAAGVVGHSSSTRKMPVVVASPSPSSPLRTTNQQGDASSSPRRGGGVVGQRKQRVVDDNDNPFYGSSAFHDDNNNNINDNTRSNSASRGRMMEGSKTKTASSAAIHPVFKEETIDWLAPSAFNVTTSNVDDIRVPLNAPFSPGRWGLSTADDDGAWDDQATGDSEWRFFDRSHSVEDTIEATSGAVTGSDVAAIGASAHDPIPLSVDTFVSNSVGTADRPISLHEIAGVRDVLDKREQDMRQNAALKNVHNEATDARDYDVLNNARVKRNQDDAEKKMMATSFSTTDETAGNDRDILDANYYNNTAVVDKNRRGVTNQNGRPALPGKSPAPASNRNHAPGRSNQKHGGDNNKKEGRTGIMRFFGGGGGGGAGGGGRNNKKGDHRQKNDVRCSRSDRDGSVSEATISSDEPAVAAPSTKRRQSNSRAEAQLQQPAGNDSSGPNVNGDIGLLLKQKSALSRQRLPPQPDTIWKPSQFPEDGRISIPTGHVRRLSSGGEVLESPQKQRSLLSPQRIRSLSRDRDRTSGVNKNNYDGNNISSMDRRVASASPTSPPRKISMLGGRPEKHHGVDSIPQQHLLGQKATPLWVEPTQAIGEGKSSSDPLPNFFDEENCGNAPLAVEVTNPPFYFETDMPIRTEGSDFKPVDREQSAIADPFDVNSPVFVTGDPFFATASNGPSNSSPTSLEAMLLTGPVESDDFSDPFFPTTGGRRLPPVSVLSTQSPSSTTPKNKNLSARGFQRAGDCEGNAIVVPDIPDPALDHLNLPDTDDDEGSSIVAPNSKQRYNDSKEEEKKEYELYDDQGIPFPIVRVPSTATSPSQKAPKSYERPTEASRNKWPPPQLENKLINLKASSPTSRRHAAAPPPPPPPLPLQQAVGRHDVPVSDKRNSHLNNVNSSKQSPRNLTNRNVDVASKSDIDNFRKKNGTEPTPTTNIIVKNNAPAAMTSLQEKKQEIAALSSSIAQKVRLRQQKKTHEAKTTSREKPLPDPPAFVGSGTERGRAPVRLGDLEKSYRNSSKIRASDPNANASRPSSPVRSDKAARTSRQTSPLRSISIPASSPSPTHQSNANRVKLGRTDSPTRSGAAIRASSPSRSRMNSWVGARKSNRRNNADNDHRDQVTNKNAANFEVAAATAGRSPPFRNKSKINQTSPVQKTAHNAVSEKSPASNRWQRRGTSNDKSYSPVPQAKEATPGPSVTPIPPPKIKRMSSGPTAVAPRKLSPLRSRDYRDVRSSSSDDDSNQVIQRTGTLESLSSVGSDIQRLRSILRRSRANKMSSNQQYLEPLESAFSVYDESKIKDPMQRAGFRLLSAAVIPIQAAARRHLALRLALTRMWAIVVIQAAIRCWFVKSNFRNQKESAVKLQTLFRGSRVRDQMLLEQCCAIEIQRHVRGLIATLHVYEDVYKITVCQACIRRKLAMDHAMDKMVSIIQIQSVVRGFLTRSKRNASREAAIKLQTAWRCCSRRFNYQLDLLDIILVQSIVRRKVAMRRYGTMRTNRDYNAATLIQTQWRRYDCLMNYLEYRAAVMIQKTWRGYDCAVNYKEYRAATIIQSQWRGYVCWMTYREHVAATILQSYWRRHVCRTEYLRYRGATAIQTLWRSVKCRRSYTVLLSAIRIQTALRAWYCRCKYREVQAAILIQSHWRSYDCTMNFLHFLADVLIAQSAFRRWAAIRKCRAIRQVNATRIQCAFRVFVATLRLKELRSAVIIQKTWRGFVCYADYMFTISDIVVAQSMARRWLTKKHYPKLLQEHKNNAVRIIQSKWRSCLQKKVYLSMVEENNSSILIQAEWRRYVAQYRYDITIDSATRIEALCRGHLTRQGYLTQQYCATVIQSTFRAVLAMKRMYYVTKGQVLIEECAQLARLEEASATRIQSIYRGCGDRHAFKMYLGARRIQSAWRGFFIRSHVNLFLKARRIQTAWRTYSVRSTYLAFVKARTIQMAWRSCKARSILDRHLACRDVQSVWRRYNARKAYVEHLASRCIQAAWRGYVARVEIALYLTARSIQAAWRGYSARKDLVFYTSARTIQAKWRGHSIRKHYVLYTSARTIQAAWRGHSFRVHYILYVSARSIQSAWRGYSACKDYVIYLSAMAIQAAWRGYSLRIHYSLFITARTIQCGWRKYSARSALVNYINARKIQAVWRGYETRVDTALYCKARKIQSAFRGHLVRVDVALFLKARAIQAAWRGYVIRVTVALYFSARCIQSAWRGCAARALLDEYRLQIQNRADNAVCNIQTSWRCHRHRKVYGRYIAARRIQTTWRCVVARLAFVEYMAARCIQSRWRRFALRNVYIEYTAARRIQAQWRRFALRNVYIEYTAARRIQAQWRGLSQRAAYHEYLAARSIQSQWRGYTLRTVYQEYVAARKIQAKWRSFSLRTVFYEYKAARKIQSKWRGVCLRQLYKEYLAARIIQSRWRGFALRSLRYSSALRIQTRWRGAFLRLAYNEYMAARLIQARWRGVALRVAYIEYFAARKIQAKWRGMSLRSAYVEYVASRRIQSLWRGVHIRLAYKCFLAARVIQSFWRCKYCRSGFKEYVASRTIQAFWRGQRLSIAYKVYLAARRIQTFWRCKHTFAWCQHFLAVRRVQKVWRGYVLRSAYKEYVSSRTIQAFWRGECLRIKYSFFLAARRIQRFWRSKKYQIEAKQLSLSIWAARAVQSLWRGFSVRIAYKEYIASRKIQSFWRGERLRIVYGIYLAARRIQTFWRGARCRHELDKFLAARTIQKVWRGKFVFSAYVYFVSARLIQKMWRMKLVSSSYNEYMSARTIQAKWRQVMASSAYNHFVSARRIQSLWRCKKSASNYKKFVLGQAFEQVASTLGEQDYRAAQIIQAYWRRSRIFKAFQNFVAARRIQSFWRSQTLSVAYRQYIAVRRIQTFYRAKTIARAYSQYRAIVKIQALFRRAIARISFVPHRDQIRSVEIEFAANNREKHIDNVAARKIQRSWRCFSARQAFWHILGSTIQIQACARGWLIRKIVSHHQHSFSTNELSIEREKGISLLEHKRKDRAARKIQHFLLMVKAEVEREIRAERKRRRAKRKMMKKNCDDDDDLILENIWRRTIEQDGFVSEKIRKASEAAARELNTMNRSKQQHSLVRSADRRPPKGDASSNDKLLRSNVSELLGSFVGKARRFDDERSEISSFSGISSIVFRNPPSRLVALSRHEIEEDLNLEEAWIDAGICNAKSRRHADRKSSKNLHLRTPVGGIVTTSSFQHRVLSPSFSESKRTEMESN